MSFPYNEKKKMSTENNPGKGISSVGLDHASVKEQVSAD
jgi:hypothetical protein